MRTGSNVLAAVKVGLEKEADNFVETCLTIPFEELVDDRDWSTLPEAREIIEAGNSGQTQEAIRLAHHLCKEIPDFDFSYNWLGHLYLQQGDAKAALNIVNEGLRRAKTKALLCTRMGMIYLNEKDIYEAIKWWIRSAALQIHSG